MSARRVTPIVVLAAALVAACDADSDEPTSESVATTSTGAEAVDDDRFPAIVEAIAERDTASGTWTFHVTVSSPYDTPDRYANGWRVVAADGTVYGVRELLHDHAVEQPFTRTQSGVVIPDHVDEVIVEGRDLVNGYGGATVTVTLDRT